MHMAPRHGIAPQPYTLFDPSARCHKQYVAPPFHMTQQELYMIKSPVPSFQLHLHLDGHPLLQIYIKFPKFYSTRIHKINSVRLRSESLLSLLL